MDPEEWEGLEACALCGARITSEAEQGFAFGTDGHLCARCATARGGRYDAERDLWDVEPDLSDLPDEAYGAAPHEVRRRGPGRG